MASMSFWAAEPANTYQPSRRQVRRSSPAGRIKKTRDRKR
jgi:hypothetical protein